MAMATFTDPPAAIRSRRAASRSSPVTADTIRRLRSTSFRLTARRSTMRFPYTLPIRIITPVETVFSTIFVAVPAFSRVEPAIASGPVSTVISWSRWPTISSGGGVHERSPVPAPALGAVLDVLVPDDAIPST